MWSNLLGFWVLGMPVCAVLAFVLDLKVVGLWIGLVTGLSCSGTSPSLQNYEHQPVITPFPGALPAERLFKLLIWHGASAPICLVAE